jgi:hypothetical protein
MARRKRVTAGELKRIISQLQVSGGAQLGLLLEIMSDRSYPTTMRVEAAMATLPYYHQPICHRRR